MRYFTLISAVLAYSGHTGLNSLLLKKFARLFLRYRCKSRSVPRPRRIEYLTTLASDLLRRWSGGHLPSLENMIESIGTEVQDIVDSIEDSNDPMHHLDLDDKSAECMNIILDNCNLSRPVSFWYAIPIWKQGYTEKIGEGTYGEIYRTTHQDGSLRIIKFMPIHGAHPETQQANLICTEVVPDVICSRYLNHLLQHQDNKAPNFPPLHYIYLVKGMVPNPIVNAWFRYSLKPDNESQFSRPDRYPKDQLFLMLEYDYCGTDMSSNESLLSENVQLCAAIICQIVAALAAAECQFEFEHRDLHAANVLLKATNKEFLDYVINGERYCIDTSGYTACIIDFSMSRILCKGSKYFMPSMSNSEHQFSDGETHWEDHNYIYDQQLQSCRDSWDDFHPDTNLLWIRHLIAHMLHIFSQNGKVPRFLLEREQYIALRYLEMWEQDVLQYESATSFFTSVLAIHTSYVTIER